MRIIVTRFGVDGLDRAGRDHPERDRQAQFMVGSDAPFSLWGDDYRWNRVFAEKMVFRGRGSRAHRPAHVPRGSHRLTTPRRAGERQSGDVRYAAFRWRCPAIALAGQHRRSPLHKVCCSRTTSIPSSRGSRARNPIPDHVLHQVQVRAARDVAGSGATHDLRRREIWARSRSSAPAAIFESRWTARSSPRTAITRRCPTGRRKENGPGPRGPTVRSVTIGV